MNNKIKYKGDGKSLYNAVTTSSLRTQDFFEKMGISRYNYYESQDLDFNTKEAVSKILNRSIEDIFGQKYIDKGSFIHTLNEESGQYDKEIIQNNNDTVNRILGIIQHANSNMEKIAEANLSLARTIEKMAPDYQIIHTKKAKAG